MTRPEPHPCGACHRVVAYRHKVQAFGRGGGKGRVRHKCPHGQWCVAGSRFGIVKIIAAISST